jgi:hypothetical protein
MAEDSHNRTSPFIYSLIHSFIYIVFMKYIDHILPFPHHLPSPPYLLTHQTSCSLSLSLSQKKKIKTSRLREKEPKKPHQQQNVLLFKDCYLFTVCVCTRVLKDTHTCHDTCAERMTFGSSFFLHLCLHDQIQVHRLSSKQLYLLLVDPYLQTNNVTVDSEKWAITNSTWGFSQGKRSQGWKCN